MLGHKCSFPNRHFLDSVRKKYKRSSGIDGKISNCLSRNCIYYRYFWVMFLLATVLWIAKTCDCCFFADFLMVRALLVKKYHIKLLKNVWCFLLFLCSLLHTFHFPFNLRHTKTWKKRALELEPEPLSWTEELRSRAVSLLRLLRSPVLVKAYSWSKFSRLWTSVCTGFLRFCLGFGC